LRARWRRVFSRLRLTRQSSGTAQSCALGALRFAPAAPHFYVSRHKTNHMAPRPHTAPIGHLQMQCATTPVLIGSPHLSCVDRHSKRAAGHRAFSAGGHLHSTAAEISAVGLLSHAPLSFNTQIIRHGAAPEGAAMSQRSGNRLFATSLCSGRPLPANPALNLAPLYVVF